MPGRYETWVRGWRLAFNGANGRAMLGGLAAVLGDRAELEARQAVREGLATEGSDETALGLLGADVQIDQGPPDYDANYRDRVAKALYQWRFAATDLGLLVALHYAGFPRGVILSQNGAITALLSTPILADLEGLTELPVWAAYETAGNANPLIPASTDGKPAIPALTVPWIPFAAGPMDAEGNQWNGRFVVFFPDGLPAGMELTIAENLARCRRVIHKWRDASKLCYSIVVVNDEKSPELWDWPFGRAWDDGAGSWWDNSGTSVFAP